MHRSRLFGYLGIGVVAGLVATRVSDRAQRWLYRLTPPEQRAREPAGEPTSKVAARKTADALGLDVDRCQLERLRKTLHYGLGASWGLFYGLLRERRLLPPIAAGALTGASLSLLVDEMVCPAAGFSRPGDEYPASAHVRGFINHLIYGWSLAAAAELLHRGAAAATPGHRGR